LQSWNGKGSGLNLSVQRSLLWIFCCAVFRSLELIGPIIRESEQKEQGLRLLPNGPTFVALEQSSPVSLLKAATHTGELVGN